MNMKYRLIVAAFAAVAGVFGVFGATIPYTADATVDTPLALAEDTEISVAEGVTVTYTAAITGNYKLTKTGPGRLILSSANNSFASLSVAAGNLEAGCAGSLGSGKITITGGSGTLRFVKDLPEASFVNDIEVNGASTSTQPAIYIEHRSKKLTLTGDVVADNNLWIGTMYLKSGSPSYNNTVLAEITGSVTIASPYVLYMSNAFDFLISGKVDADTIYLSNTTTKGLYPTEQNNSPRAMFRLGNSNNRIGLVDIEGYISLKAACENAFGGARVYNIASGETSRTQVYAETYDQVIASLSSGSCAAKNIGTTAMQLRGTGTITMTGGVASASNTMRVPSASLVIDDRGEDGTFVQEFKNRPSETEGTITVKRGTMRLAGTGSFSNLTGIAVLADGNFEVTTTASQPFKRLQSLSIAGGFSVSGDADFASSIFDDDLVDLKIISGSTITLPAGTVWKVRSLNIDGEPMSAKPQTHDDDVAIPEGVTIIPLTEVYDPEYVTWTGNGGADTSLSTAANWAEKTHPLNFAQDRYHVTFADGGALATFDGMAIFKSLTFKDGGFTIRGTSDEAYVNLTGPMTFNDGVQPGNCYTIDAPIVLNDADYSWQTPAGTALVVTNGLTTTCDLTLDGAGTNYLGGVCVVDGKLTINKSITYLSGTLTTSSPVAAASANNQLILNYSQNPSGRPYSCIFNNAYVYKNVKLTPISSQNSLVTMAGSSNVIYGAYSQGTPTSKWLLNGDIEFAGGVTIGWTIQKSGSGRMIVSNKPASFVGKNADSRFKFSSGALVLNVASNNFSTTQHLQMNSSRLQCGVPYVFSSAMDFFELAGTSVMDVGSFDQRIGYIGVAAGATITGEYPAQIDICTGAPEDTKNKAMINCKVTGGVGFKMTGPKGNVLLLTNQTFTSCGDLTATNGVLELAANASWLNGTNFTAKGEGKLKFAAAKQVDRKIANLHFAENGKIYVPAGVTLKVAAADVLEAGADEPTSVALGVYDGTSGLLSGRIEGGGNVMVGPAGIVLIVR